MRRGGIIDRRVLSGAARVPFIGGGGGGSAPAPPFSPTDIAGCVAWFDMQDSGNYTDTAGFITSINNKASAVAWEEATVPPAFSATAFNGLPCMDFDATQYIVSTEAAVAAALNGDLAYTVFVAGQVDTADASLAFFGAGYSASLTARTRYFGNNVTGSGVWISASRNNANGTVNAESSSGAADTNPHVLEWHTDGATTSIQEDGATADPDDAAQVTGASAPDRVGIGCRAASTPNVLLNGRIGEILLYNTRLSAPNRALVRAYLGTKWGITVA